MRVLELLQTALIDKAEKRWSTQSVCKKPEGTLYINHYCVMLADLPEIPDRIELLKEVDLLLRKALVIRNEILSQAGASDLNLFLVAPKGSKDNLTLKSIAAEIERDDRVCRKLVWLPDDSGSDISEFIERTFLATPWEANSTGTGVDGLRILGSALDLPEGWEEALLNPELTGQDLIKQLMENAEL